MHTSPTIRKIFEGVATRHDMYRMFNRHRGNPTMAESDAGHLFAGEWFEICEADHDYMFEILPPLFVRPDMFAMREYLTGSVTERLLLALDRRPQAFLPQLLRSFGQGLSGSHQGGDHRARIAAGPRHDARRTPRSHLVKHPR